MDVLLYGGLFAMYTLAGVVSAGVWEFSFGNNLTWRGCLGVVCLWPVALPVLYWRGFR